MASPAGYSEDVWAAIAEMGLLGVPFDEAHGGFGGTTVDIMLVMEAIGEGLLVEPYLATVGLGGRFVARAGTKAQQDRILPALIQGKHTLAFAHTEPGARYDLRAGRPAGDAGRATAGCSTATSAWCCTAAAPTRWWSPRARRAGRPTPPASRCSWCRARRPGVSVKEYRTIDNLRAADIRFAGVRRRAPTRCSAARARAIR